MAMADTGDLDPTFADHGRLTPIGNAGGAALFVEALSTGDILVGGGDFDLVRIPISEPGYCPFSVKVSSFAGELGEDGVVAPPFDSNVIAGVEALDMARQSDGKIVGVGRSSKFLGSSGRCSNINTPVVFRLESDGSPDASFGTNGVMLFSTELRFHAVVLEPDGRIVIGESRRVTNGGGRTKNVLTVTRLLPDGSLDQAFGTEGSYFGPEIVGNDGIRLTRLGSGGYRAVVQSTGGCNVVGITMQGAPDGDFGSGGVVTLSGPDGARVTCMALESAPDDSLFVAGIAQKHGFVARLLASGEPDPAFSADSAISTSLNQVTSVAIAADGKLLVAGTAPKGTSILRLHATGGRDADFGDAGRTWIDLNSWKVSKAIVRAMTLRDDGSVIAVGGDANSDRPFVVRLLGDGGGTSAGVVGFSKGHAAPQESDGKAILRARRSGGSDGNVSVGYRTVADLDAKENTDFVPKAGRLHWAAGEMSEKSIVIDIVQRNVTPEALEPFHVVVEDAQGGAGLGSNGAQVDIQPDGAPGGQIEFEPWQSDATENYSFQLLLRRNYYFQGRVCVTVTARSGSAAAGDDFSSEPAVVCWADQETDGKLPEIDIVDDSLTEGRETFTVELSNPTGGAIIGPKESITIRLYDNE